MPMNTKSYSVTFDYLYYSVNYLMSNNKGNEKLFAIVYPKVVIFYHNKMHQQLFLCKKFDCTNVSLFFLQYFNLLTFS